MDVKFLRTNYKRTRTTHEYLSNGCGKTTEIRQRIPAVKLEIPTVVKNVIARVCKYEPSLRTVSPNFTCQVLAQKFIADSVQNVQTIRVLLR